jgi:hypothetical protein
MRPVCILALLAGSASAQLTVRFSPGPLDTFRAVGAWNVEACNDYAVPITAPPERVSMAAGQLRLLRPAQATQLMASRRAKSAKFIAAEVIEYALMGAGVFGGSDIVTMSKKTLGGIAAATGVAHQLQDKWRGEVPPLPTFDGDLFSAPINLAAGACTTRSVWALKMPRAQVVPMAAVQIPLPGLPKVTP